MEEWSFKEMFLFNNIWSSSDTVRLLLSNRQLSTLITPDNSAY
jgi:hypothetical protein